MTLGTIISLAFKFELKKVCVQHGNVQYGNVQYGNVHAVWGMCMQYGECAVYVEYYCVTVNSDPEI